MKRIYKYNILFNYHLCKTELRVPTNSTLLHIGKQGGSVQAWFEVDDSAESYQIREFYCLYTGDSYNDSDLTFRATIVYDSTYVIHIRKEYFAR